RATAAPLRATGGARASFELRPVPGHLERDAHGLRALVEPRARLRLVVRREDAVADGQAVLQGDVHDAPRRLVAHHLEVIGLAADHAADRRERVKATRLREPL